MCIYIQYACTYRKLSTVQDGRYILQGRVERGRYRCTAGVSLQYPAMLPSRADLVNDLAICESLLHSLRSSSGISIGHLALFCTILNKFFPSLFPSSFLSRPAAMSPSTTYPVRSSRQIGPRARRQRERELLRESVSPIHRPNPRRHPQTHDNDLPGGLSSPGTISQTDGPRKSSED